MVGKLMKDPLYKAVYLAFVFFVVIPVIYTVISAFFTGGSLRDNLQLFDSKTFILLFKSIIIAFTIALLSTFFGAVIGFILYKTNLRLRGFFKMSLLIPLFVSPYILAVAWKDLFFALTGNTAYISSYAGVIIVLTLVFTPLAMLITGSALSNIDRQLEESGLMITGFRKVVFRITVPIVKPALMTSFVLIFIFSISEFSVPAFFGVRVFTTEIFTQFSAFYNHSLAILQSSVLIIICILLLFSEKRYIADAPFLSIGSKGTGRKLFDMGKKNIPGLIFLWFWFFISVALPFIILMVQSFKEGTKSFVDAFELLLPTFGNSISLAIGGALIIVFIGFTAAYRSGRQQGSGKTGSLDWFLLIIFAIPSTILGISLIKFYNHPVLQWIYSGYAIILIGYAGKFSFISAKLIENAIGKIPASLDEAAQIEGISKPVRILKILLPLITPALFAAFVISFIFSLGELGTTIMVYPPGTEIMPVKVYTIMANAPQSLTSSMTLIVFSLTLLMISGFYLIAKPVINRYGYNDRA